MDSVIQWNCRGMKNKFEELKLFVKDCNPVAICLQESFLLKDDSLTFKNYTIYSHPASDDNGKAHGGTLIMVRNDVAHNQVTINSTLQAVVVTLTLHKKFTLCSVYLPPALRIDIAELDRLMGQISGPFIILGDFNAHSLLWGCRTNNPKGEIIENFIQKHDMCVFNDGSQTYLHPATGSTSALDLSLCHPNLFLDFNWKVADDLCGSDHFPILLQTVDGLQQNLIPHFKLHRADWTKFQSLCEERLVPDLFEDQDHPMDIFTRVMYQVAEDSIPRTSNKKKRIYYPWFNNLCKASIKIRKKALHDFNRMPTNERLFHYKMAAAKSRRTIRRATKDSWKS